MLPSIGADKVLIILVRGIKSQEDLNKNPLSEKEQIELIYSLYKDDPQVEIYKKFPKSSFIKDLAEHIHSTGYIVSGWLTGEDRLYSYRAELNIFDPLAFLETNSHQYSPFLKDKFGNSKVEMIEAERITSGTQAREEVKYLDPETWLKKFAPSSVLDNQNEEDKQRGISKQLYLNIYYRLKGEIGLNEMSAMGGGVVAGALKKPEPGIFRK